jgi:rRNA-processing protein FCF1
MKVLLDANFLMIPGKFRVDVFAELQKFGNPEICTLDLVIKELEKLSRGKGENAGNARLALGMVKEKGVRILKTAKGARTRARGRGTITTDSEIERIAAEGDYTVCTQDKALIERLKKEGVQVIHLRQKRYLEFSFV